MVKVDVEYCGVCNFEGHCKLLKEFLEKQKAEEELNVECHKGRRGSFEVKINDTLVHSKLQCLAFPEPASVLQMVRRAEQGLPLDKVKEEPITECVVM